MTAPQAGPYQTIGNGTPFYIVQFDKGGGRLSPETEAHALEVLASGDFSDAIVFCHGWNNDWAAATAKYNGFLTGFEGLFGDEPPAGPTMLLGIFWPSAILVMPGEQAPAMAGGDGAGPLDETFRGEIAQVIGAEGVGRLEELCVLPTLDEDETVELATLLGPVFAGGIEELSDADTQPSPQDLATSWLSSPPFVASKPSAAAADDDWGTADAAHAGPRAAAMWDRINPRDVVRAATVWLMKDRAGRVGAIGVGPLLRHVLSESAARVHLVGHSFGAKVMLSALCADQVSRPVQSVLLLQPAVNYLCFAEQVPGRDPGTAGGFRRALDRVEQPILSTYSANDQPLTKFFQWALRRTADVGEPAVAGWPEPPNDYAALGGYGPHGADADTQWVDIKDPPDAYDLDPQRRIAAVNGTARISGHSDISVPATWWTLHELMRR